MATSERSNGENGEFGPSYLCHDYERFEPESWLQASFHSQLVHRFVAIGLEKMKFCFRICGEIVSPSDFVTFVWTHAYSFPKLMVFYFGLVELSVNLENIVDKVDKEDKLVENWTRGR